MPADLEICARLNVATGLSFDVTRAFDHAVYDDCRVSWVIDLYLKADKRAQFLNTLQTFNTRLWGCNAPGPTSFGLIYDPVPLTLGDVATLIDDYIAVATGTLELSDPEIAALRAVLGHLAAPLISDSTCELSHSRCMMDAGEGGSASSTGGMNGSGGSEASGGVPAGGGVSGEGGAAGEGGEGDASGAGGAAGEGGAGGTLGSGGAPESGGTSGETGGAKDASPDVGTSDGGEPSSNP